MVIINNAEDLTSSSGIINMPFLDSIYHSFMSEALQDLGGQRGPVTFHLPPTVQQDTPTQAQVGPQQYNPFFQRVPVPSANTRNTGIKVTPRDVIYTAHIRVGPLDTEQDVTGAGRLKLGEARITVVAEALQHAKQALSVSIEGRRYTVIAIRPIGFTQRRYLMIVLAEIQESEQPSTNITEG